MSYHKLLKSAKGKRDFSVEYHSYHKYDTCDTYDTLDSKTGEIMTEKDLVEQIRRYLNSVKDLFFWKEHGGQFGTAGIPDIIVCYKGRFIGFECKQPGRKPTRLQSITLRKIMLAGGLGIVVTSLYQVKEVIESI